MALLCFNAANAQGGHPLFDAKWWVNAGSFLSQADFDAEASGTVAGDEREFDFEQAFGFDDTPALFMGEVGWQYTENWALAVQYFQSGRDGSRTIDETIEWQDEIYDVGAVISASTDIRITRFFFARRVKHNEKHSVRVGGGFHWLDVEASLAGEARIDDTTTEFRRSAADAQLPIPNFGVWYRYTPNQKWLLTGRVDWLSASMDNWSGDIWNVSGGVSYSVTDHIGVGLNYQYFEISGSLEEDSWRGSIKTTFTGPFVYLSGYW